MLENAETTGLRTVFQGPLPSRTGGLESREWNTRLALSRGRDISFIVIGREKCMDIRAAKVDFEVW